MLYIHYNNKIFPIQVIKGTKKKDIEEQIHQLLNIHHSVMLEYKNEHGEQMVISALIPHHTKIFVKIYNTEFFVKKIIEEEK